MRACSPGRRGSTGGRAAGWSRRSRGRAIEAGHGTRAATAACQTAAAMSSPPPDWAADAVFYQIYPDRFARSARVPKLPRLEAWDSPPTHHGYKGGDLLGVVEHLDWLADLGVTALYLNPIFQSASNHRYHAYDYFRVDPMLGGNEAFDALIAAAHGRGIRVVLDGVFNHTGRGFFPFHDVLENGADSPYFDWFTVHHTPVNAYDLSRPPSYEAWWRLHALPKLNTANPAVREYLMGVAEHWIRRGADGWRLDVPEEIATPGLLGGAPGARPSGRPRGLPRG